MQPSRSRLVCRAHNRFTPSIALWQHFVAPSRTSLHQQRLSSSATGDTHTSAKRHGELLNSQEASALTQLEAETVESEKRDKEPQVNIRKLTTAKGLSFSNKVEASIAKNMQLLHDSRQASLNHAEELLATAKAAFNGAEDYEGVSVKPMRHPADVKESHLPWCLTQEESRTMSGIDRLAMEIERFYEFTRPTRFEKIVRKHLIEQVRNHVQQMLPDHVLEVFGSERTGIALATSDIDFRLMREAQISDPIKARMPPTQPQRSEAFKDLRKLYWEKMNRHHAYMLAAFRYARYPLISLQDKQSGLNVQIVLANDSSLSREFMQGYMEEYPYLRQLYCVVKTMFDIRGLSDVFRGGFGSYSLFMMIVASIRHDPHPRQDAAGGLINFLKFFSDFDTRQHGISIEPTFLFDKSSEPVMTDTVKSKLKARGSKPLPAYMLSLRDPADETNDLGRKGIAIKHVQATFKTLSQQLHYNMKVNTRATMLGPLVGPSYMLEHSRRRRLEDYGRRLMYQMQKSLRVKAKAIRDRETKDSMEGLPWLEEEANTKGPATTEEPTTISEAPMEEMNDSKKP